MYDDEATDGSEADRIANGMGGKEQNVVKSAIKKPLPPIFKLNLDCCDEIFALLSLEDLHSISKTCKALQQVGGFYFQHNYETLKIWIIYGAFRLDRLRLDAFSPFIENICFDDAMENFQFAGTNCSSWIRKIFFDVVSITEAKIECIKHILGNVEVIMLSECVIEDDIYEILFKCCPNLKRLSVVFYEGFQDQWLSQKYSSLEYLKLAGQVTFRFSDVKGFFENNPNCRNFWIDGRYLMENRDSLMASRLKWCDLTVSMASIYAENMNRFLVLFEELHRQGTYQRLHLFLHGKEWNDAFFERLVSVPALVNLCLEYFENFDVENLHDLKKLEIYMPINVMADKMTNIAMSLVNLERIVFREASTNDILPFIRHSKKLMEIRVCLLKDGIHFNDNRLNLFQLNEERKSLRGARKVTIYVTENVFLTTNWTTAKAKFSLLEIRRLSAYQDPSCYATYI